MINGAALPDKAWGRRFVRSVVAAYPGRTLAASLCILMGGLSEGVSVASLLPLLGVILGQGPEEANWLSRAVTQALLSVGLTPNLVTLLAVIVVMMIVKTALLLAAMRQAGYTVAQVETDLRLALIRALMKARWEYFVSQREGVLSNALTIEAERAALGYWRVCRIAAFSVQVAVYVVISWLVSWQVTLAAILASVIGVALLGQFVAMSRRAGARQTELLQSISARLLEGLGSIKPLKAMACENLLAPLLEADARGLNKARRKQVLSYEGRYTLYEPVLAVLVALGLYGTVVIWKTGLESVMLLGLLFWRALSRVNGIQGEYQELARVESAYWSLMSTIEGAEAVSEVNSGGQEPALNRGIALQDVSFSYGDRPVLQDVSLTIPVGSFTAVMGPSGAGKTTIADLIIGLIRPQKGDVYVDGVGLGELNLRSWRSLIGYVPQETILFHDTIGVNVLLGNPDLTEKDAEESLRAAGAWEFVTSLPDGIHTVVGERGTKLSGGQRQRIAIARALVRNPKLLILDEVTSALDPATERALCGTLDTLKGKATILAISHQQALVDVADNVYFLKPGAGMKERS